MKIKLVLSENGITGLGFRKIATIAKEFDSSSEVYFVPGDNLSSFKSHLFPNREIGLTDKDIVTIADTLSDADLLCFSAMTPDAKYVERIIQEVRKRSTAYILWGGTHCILYPEEALKYADAICTWEGEISFKLFLENFESTDIPNIRYKDSQNIKTNFDRVDTKFYYGDALIFENHGWRKLGNKEYMKYHGLTYRTIWSLGCPYMCSFCANDAFIAINKNYKKIYYPPVDFIINEVKEGIKRYPFVKTVSFYDDNFIHIPLNFIKEFAEKYKKEINLPFAVFGVYPDLVDREKLEVLCNIGLNRVRMGIQSGSQKTLKMYTRPTQLPVIKKAVQTLAELTKKYKMIPPAYDIISDNPLESREDCIETLNFIYIMARPFTLTIFSLRLFPKTKLWDIFKGHPLREGDTSYLNTHKTIYNSLLYLLAVCRPPLFIFNFLIKFIDKKSSILYFSTRVLYFISRGLSHLKKFDFSNMTGTWVYYLWRIKKFL